MTMKLPLTMKEAEILSGVLAAGIGALVDAQMEMVGFTYGIDVTILRSNMLLTRLGDLIYDQTNLTKEEWQFLADGKGLRAVRSVRDRLGVDVKDAWAFVRRNRDPNREKAVCPRPHHLLLVGEVCPTCKTKIA